MAKGKAKAVRGATKRVNRTGEDHKADSYVPQLMFADELEKLYSLAVFVVSAAVYIYTMYPGLPGGDSGELMATAKDFGVSHPPGYPLFTTMAAIIINFLPFGSTAWKVNLLSATIGAMTNVMIYLAVKRFSGSDSAGILTCGWCGFSRIFWMWNIQGEVFSLSNFFAALIMYSAWRFANAETKSGRIYEAELGALICGLALTNQHTSVLFIAPTSLWVLFMLYRERIDFYSLLKVGLWGLAGLSPYLQLPISSMFFKARVSWGDHRLFSDFKKHLLREDFGTFRLVSSAEQSTLFDNFMVYFNDSCQELTIAVWILFFISIIVTIIRGNAKQKEAMMMYVSMFSVYFLVFGSLANIKDPKGIFHGVLERFWLQPNVALCIISGSGLGMLLSLCEAKTRPLKYIFLSVAIAAIAFQVQRNYFDCNENDNYHFWHYSRHILDHLPKRSILLTSGDFSTNTFRYHTIGEEYRTDVMVMDMQFMQAYWFYICLMPINFPDVSFPGLYKAGKDSVYPHYNLKRFLDENYDRFPIYMCTAVPPAEDSIIGFYEEWPFGICKKLVRVADNLDPLEHLQTMPKIDLDTMPLPDPDRYETRTWEHTMMMSMLESFIKPPTWLWNRANAIGDKSTKVKYYQVSLEMMLNGVANLTRKIDEGVLTESGLMPFVAPIHKQVGHVALILYTHVKSDSEQAAYYEALVRHHWEQFMKWRTDELSPPDEFLKTIQTILATKDLSTLNIR